MTEDKLIVPSWVPKQARATALEIYEKFQGTKVGTETVLRLATHPKMQRVWIELQRKRGGRPKYFNPLIPGRIPDLTLDFEDRLGRFFYYAWCLAEGHPTMSSARTRRSKAKQYYHLLRELLLISIDLELESNSRPDALPKRKQCATLLAAAQVLRREADFLQGRDPYFVERSTGGSRALAFAVSLCFYTELWLGALPFGHIATVISVALNKPVTKDAVRSWYERSCK